MKVVCENTLAHMQTKKKRETMANNDKKHYRSSSNSNNNSNNKNKNSSSNSKNKSFR